MDPTISAAFFDELSQIKMAAGGKNIGKLLNSTKARELLKNVKTQFPQRPKLISLVRP
jgi:hypothetical protein